MAKLIISPIISLPLIATNGITLDIITVSTS